MNKILATILNSYCDAKTLEQRILKMKTYCKVINIHRHKNGLRAGNDEPLTMDEIKERLKEKGRSRILADEIIRDNGYTVGSGQDFRP